MSIEQYWSGVLITYFACLFVSGWWYHWSKDRLLQLLPCPRLRENIGYSVFIDFITLSILLALIWPVTVTVFVSVIIVMLGKGLAAIFKTIFD